MALAGIGRIVMRSSSDWVRTQSGEWVKAPIKQTRGLNRNSNRMLKGIFKGAAERRRAVRPAGSGSGRR